MLLNWIKGKFQCKLTCIWIFFFFLVVTVLKLDWSIYLYTRKYPYPGMWLCGLTGCNFDLATLCLPDGWLASPCSLVSAPTWSNWALPVRFCCPTLKIQINNHQNRYLTRKIVFGCFFLLNFLQSYAIIRHYIIISSIPWNFAVRFHSPPATEFNFTPWTKAFAKRRQNFSSLSLCLYLCPSSFN